MCGHFCALAPVEETKQHTHAAKRERSRVRLTDATAAAIRTGSRAELCVCWVVTTHWGRSAARLRVGVWAAEETVVDTALD